MPTAAVNRNTTTSVPFMSYNPSTGVWSSAGSHAVAWDRKVRPASSSNPIVGGWRNCGGWTHWGYRGALRGGTTFRKRISPLPEALQVGYTEGAMWIYSPLTTVPLPSASQTSEAEVKALEKLKNQSIHLGVAIAEGKRTVNMIAKTATGIARQVTNYRRRNGRDWELVKRYENGSCPRSKWNLIPDSWLQLQYGWIPLLQDIVGGIAATQTKFEQGALVRVRSMVERPWNETRTASLRSGGTSLGWKTRITGKHNVYVNLWYELTNPGLAQLSSLGLVNPAEIVWEMVPYSFVVDWFAPIGPWMSSLTGATGYTFKGGSLSRITRGTEAVMEIDHSSPTQLIYGGFPTVHSEYWNFARSCYGSSPVPGIYLKNPFTSVRRGLNALALLAQAFSR